jgi:hypothetical protein
VPRWKRIALALAPLVLAAAALLAGCGGATAGQTGGSATVAVPGATATAAVSWKTNAQAVIAEVEADPYCREGVYNATAEGQPEGALGDLKTAVQEGNKQQAMELTKIVRDAVAQYC